MSAYFSHPMQSTSVNAANLILEVIKMKENYKPLKSMKEVPDQLRKLRREYIRYGQAEFIYRNLTDTFLKTLLTKYKM